MNVPTSIGKHLTKLGYSPVEEKWSSMGHNRWCIYLWKRNRGYLATVAKATGMYVLEICKSHRVFDCYTQSNGKKLRIVTRV